MGERATRSSRVGPPSDAFRSQSIARNSVTLAIATFEYGSFASLERRIARLKCANRLKRRTKIFSQPVVRRMAGGEGGTEKKFSDFCTPVLLYLLRG